MDSTNGVTGSQEPNETTRARRTSERAVAQCANSTPAVRQQTRQHNTSSIRRPDADENTDTHSKIKEWLPASVSESEGRNDKVHIVCKIATVKCKTREDARNFVLHCGAAPELQRGEHELFSKLFTTASMNGDGNTLKIRSSVMRCDGQDFQPPVFTGKLKFHRVLLSQTGEGSGIAVFVTADLCLNVNRALNHRRGELASGGHDAIFENTDPVKRGLCRNDNLAPFDLEDGEHDKAREAFFTSVIDALFDDVKRAAEVSRDAGSEWVEVTGSPSEFSLREVETCWDIKPAGLDAVQALAGITPGLFEHGAKRGWEGNGGTVTMEFSKWERLAVYAKAPDRLRFEIRHYPPNGNLPYSAPTISATLAKLDTLRRRAAETLNDVLFF